MIEVNRTLNRTATVLKYVSTGLVALLLAFPVLPVNAQRGSFRGGGSSFGRSSSGFGGGGGGFGRSSSSGSFGRSNTGSSFGNSPSRSSSSGSFGRSGTFGSQSYTGSSSPVQSYSYGGRNYSAHYYGGYGDYWYHPSWYYWMPFHPAFYYNAPYMGSDGYYYPGGFSFMRLLEGLLVFAFVIWLISRIFGGGKGVRYTTYN